MKHKQFKHKRFKAVKDYKRLDHFLSESLPEMSRSQAVGLIKDNRVRLNGEVISRKNLEITIGDILDLEIPEPEERDYKPSFELKRLYEDEYIMVIDKPCGIAVHPGSGEPRETILDVFRYNYPQIEEIPDTDRPGIVHRLDRDTSGVLILAKDMISMGRLQKQFRRREVKKTYLALAYGRMRYRNGTIDEPIGRSTRNRTRYRVVEAEGRQMENAREAVTDYTVIREYDDFSFVRLFPLTGRTHQLRVHLTHSGNPIVGDSMYGRGSKSGGKLDEVLGRLALHAYSVEFYHPHSRNLIRSYSPLPREFRDFLVKG